MVIENSKKNERLTHDTANLVTSYLTAREHNFICGGSVEERTSETLFINKLLAKGNG